MHFTIRVPKRRHRRAHYISPATESLTLAIAPAAGGSNVVSETVNLTNCTAAPCTITVDLAPDSYDATIATYDGTNATGNVLSEGQKLAFTVKRGKANDIALTLSGVPFAITVSPGSRQVRTLQGGGLAVYGSASQPLIATATDADGNVIVGAGSPSFSASVLSGSGWSFATPSPSKPNVIMVTPPDSDGAGAVVRVTGAFAGGATNGCAHSGAVCTAQLSLVNEVPTLIVGSGSGLLVFRYPYTATPQVNTENGGTLTFDSAGNLLSASSATGEDIYEYAPPYTGTPTTIDGGQAFDFLYSTASSTTGYFAAASVLRNNVTLFTPPYTSSVATVSTLVAQPYVVAFGPNAALFVGSDGECTSGSVNMYAPPYTGAPTLICDGIDEAISLRFDAAGDLFVANRGNGTVTEYVPPYTSPPIATLTTPHLSLRNDQMAMDAAGNLFIADDSTDDVVREFVPPYTGSAIRIAKGVVHPVNVILDGTGNLIVSNCNTSCGGSGSDTITIYAPPYTGSPITTIDVDNAFAFALTP